MGLPARFPRLRLRLHDPEPLALLSGDSLPAANMVQLVIERAADPLHAILVKPADRSIDVQSKDVPSSQGRKGLSLGRHIEMKPAPPGRLVPARRPVHALVEMGESAHHKGAGAIARPDRLGFSAHQPPWDPSPLRSGAIEWLVFDLPGHQAGIPGEAAHYLDYVRDRLSLHPSIGRVKTFGQGELRPPQGFHADREHDRLPN